MTTKQLLFSALILGFITHNVFSTEPRVFTMNLNKNEFDSSMPIPSSKFSTTQALVAIYLYDLETGVEKQVIVPIGTIEDISKVIKNGATDSSSLSQYTIDFLKFEQEKNKFLDGVYYPSVVTNEKERRDAIVLGTQRVDFTKDLELIYLTKHFESFYGSKRYN